MTVTVDLYGQPDRQGESSLTFADEDLPADRRGTYCYHVGAGGELFIVVDHRGEGRVDRAYGPTAWRCVTGDVWRKGMLLQG